MYKLALFFACLLLPMLGMCQIFKRESCSSSYFLCQPVYATSSTLGQIGPSWDGLYNDLIDTVGAAADNSSSKEIPTVDPSGPAKREGAFCCSLTTECLLVKNYSIPVCWDQFTTNVFFPDGTYGNIVSGQFTTADGDTIDMVYGNYTMKNGSKGNIYDSSVGSTAPDTSTMNMPTPFTSSGVRSAIPATELGTTGMLVTVTTTISLPPSSSSTMPSITVTAPGSGCPFCVANGTTIAGPTITGGTGALSTSVYISGVLPMPYVPKNDADYVAAGTAGTSVAAIVLMFTALRTALFFY